MSDTASPWVVDVTEANFETDVLEASHQHPVLVDFWADWCGPCRTLGPILERLVNERGGRVTLAKVNTEEAPGLAQAFRISAIPAVKIIYQGQLVHEFEGLQPESALRELLDQIAPDADPALTQAQSEELSSPARAEKHYRDILAEQPDNDEARLGLARVLLAQERFDEVPAVLEPVSSSGPAGTEADRIKGHLYLARACKDLPDEAALRAKVSAEPKNAAARVDLGIRLACREQYEEALATLLSAAELDYKLASGRVREVMVQVFYALGSNHPLANDYRGRLTRLLY
jgi:putative thioredoxin